MAIAESRSPFPSLNDSPPRTPPQPKAAQPLHEPTHSVYSASKTAAEFTVRSLFGGFISPTLFV